MGGLPDHDRRWWAGRGRRGKSGRAPAGAPPAGLSPDVAEGDDADELVEEAQRRSTQRRELARTPQFAEISPTLGELDEDALEQGLQDDPDRTLGLLAEMTGATDAALRARARLLAGRLWLRLARQGRARSTGIGRIAPVPYRPDAGDLDLDRSMDTLVAARASRSAISADELWVRSWAAPSTAWCLVVDRSGSMHGASLATAALATAAVTHRAGPRRAVLSFAREVVAVASMADGRPDEEVVESVLALRGHGTTDVAAALRAAADQLARTTAARRVTVLLSDCRATEPGDVPAAAALLDELVVLAPADDAEEATALAGEVGARLGLVAGPSDVPAALGRALDAPT